MLNTIISLCEKRGFLRKLMLPRLNAEQFKFGPTGLLLREILRTEWFYSLVINKDISIFLSDENFTETYNFARTLCMDKLPFGIAEIVENRRHTSDGELIAYYNSIIKNGDINFAKFFNKEDQALLRCTVFTPATDSTQFFHQWQRQRRIWWRKCSLNPGRYRLTDIKTDDSQMQHVDILADYPWNSQILETIVLHPSPKKINKVQLQCCYKFMDGKRKVEAHAVVSEINMAVMFLNTICDAFDETTFNAKSRTLLRLHRKLAPYKISFAVSGTTVVSELKDLALYLTKQLRVNHVSTLYLPNNSKLTLEAQWKQYDQLGIPFNVLLNEGTLKDGVAYLRSRDTTLKEQIHITNLVDYVEKLFKNY
ncbi:DNA polymerase subunit gamma-2, mitochondrial isoform X2 [Cylas formicarius]|uniref:DNA polymerase subunit gamma-2, mitochondrial isoform X2 n=1 Tax=Cylas formicarius TaxID=197179 RepID=UPI002958AFCB|nr:DNA polymerase subunit gamma-2, mitochondrial isoform X2 [Cylas formicarius]